ncbi:hypothetical protein SEPCBS57363_003546 [Sporothrix epigloea]|uniref:Uncharacterized protein n=1 Tax=Sporothrix epigloea TaxID=1892477 RepID=A0ABP0DM14_9PEZI
MAEGNDEPKNLFIRWKQHVDAHIGMTLHGLLGIPNIVSKNFNIHQEPNSGAGPAPAVGAQPPSSTSTASALSPSQANASSSSNSHSNYDSSLPNPTSSSDNGDGLDSMDAGQLLAWHKFVYYSPYSPLQLQQQQHLHMLPPPIPQDVPFGADPFAFNYADAFEDLLRCSSGRPLLDLADRSYRNLCYQMRYGSAFEPPHTFFHRMHSQQLLDAYFPRARVEDSSVEVKSGAVVTPNESNLRIVSDLAEQDRDLWREQRAEEDANKLYEDRHDDDRRAWDDGAVDGHDYDHGRDRDESTWTQKSKSGLWGFDNSGSLFGELDRVFRVLGRIIDEDTGAAAERSRKDASSTPSSNLDKTEADAEDELYNSMRSAYSSAERSLGTLIRTFTSHFDSPAHGENSSSSFTSSSPSPSSSPSFLSSSFSSTSAESLPRMPDSNQGETVETTEEHVDVFGNRHVKILVQRLDADGNEVARETRYTIRSHSAQEPAAVQKDAHTDSKVTDKNTNNTGKDNCGEKNQNTSPRPAGNSGASRGSGWFWK